MQFGNGNNGTTQNTNNVNNINNNTSTSGRRSIQNRSIERAEARMDSSKDTQERVIQSIVGQHNYSAQARQPAATGIMGFLRKKLQPVFLAWDKFHEKARESSRFIRRIVNGLLIGGMVVGLIGGHFAKIGISVPNAKVPSTKAFLNADTVRLTHETYDPNNGAMELHLTTKGVNGSIGASQLTSQLEMAEAPKTHFFQASPRMPVVTVIPTFNDHFIVMVRHLYKGFDGLEINLHNRANVTPASLSDALNNSDSVSKKLSGKQQETIEKVAQNGVTNYHKGNQSQRLIKKIERENRAKFVVREETAKADHKGYVDPDESSEQIAMNALRKHLKFDYRTIRSNDQLIKSEKQHIKYNNKQIRQINRNADIGNKQSDLAKAREDIQSAQGQIKQYKETENHLQKDVNTTLTLISRVNVHIAQIPKRTGKVKASIFHPDN